MKRLLIVLSFFICHLSFSVAQSDDIEVTDSTSTDWDGGIGGGGLNPQTPNDPVTELSISQTSLTLEGGETVRLVATVNQRAGNKKILWSSANEDIASVDAVGRVMGLSVGNTVITATAAGNPSLEKTCRVTVTSDYVRKAPQALLPNVPFEFYYHAKDYDEANHSIPNQGKANLKGASLQLEANLPTVVDGRLLRINDRCEGYIDRWPNGSTESGAYFYRGGQDCMTIVAKVAPQLNRGNASDFISNRGGGYNYMWRIGEGNSSFLHTAWGYDEGRSLPLDSELPQVLAVRVDGVNDCILLQNLTTGESKRVEGVNWGGGDNVFKLFYNDDGEFFLGDFYWVYYSFELLTDAQLQAVVEADEGKLPVTLSLNEGWNWVSQPQRQPVAVSTIVGDDGQRVLSQTEEIICDPVLGWVGTLTVLEPGMGYKVQMKAAHSVTLTPDYYAHDDIRLNKGWNWIGYTVGQVQPLDDALAVHQANEGDYIVTQQQFAEFAEGQWRGSLKSMAPGKGYLYKAMADELLTYSRAVSHGSAAVRRHGVVSGSLWTPDWNAYPDVMLVTARLYRDGEPVTGGNYAVGAFANGECRGVGEWEDDRMMMNVCGQPGDVIRFVAADTISHRCYDIAETIAFVADVKGSWRSPIVLTLDAEQTAATAVTADRLLTVGWGNGSIHVSAAGQHIGQLTLTNMAGQNVRQLSDAGTAAAIDVHQLPAGIYILTVQTGGKTHRKKLYL